MWFSLGFVTGISEFPAVGFYTYTGGLTSSCFQNGNSHSTSCTNNGNAAISGEQGRILWKKKSLNCIKTVYVTSKHFPMFLNTVLRKRRGWTPNQCKCRNVKRTPMLITSKLSKASPPITIKINPKLLSLTKQTTQILYWFSCPSIH